MSVVTWSRAPKLIAVPEFEIDDRGLAGIAIAVMRKQLRDRAIGDAELMVAEHAVIAGLLPPFRHDAQCTPSFRGRAACANPESRCLVTCAAAWIPGSRKSRAPE